MAGQTIKSLPKSKKVLAVRALLVVALLSTALFFIWLKLAPSSAILPVGSLQRTWSSGVVKEGQSVDLVLDLEPGKPTDTVVAKIRYNPDQLKYSSVSYDDSPFPTQAPTAVTDDSVTILALIMGGETVQEKARVAKLTFESKTSHSPKVTISGNSALAGSAHNPYVEGMSLKDAIESAPLLVRTVVSLFVSVVLAAALWGIYRLINKKRGQRKNNAIT